MKDDRLKNLDMQKLDIPALPAVASRAIQILQRDNATVNDIEDVLMTDQGFSTRLLRTANSPYYGRGRAIDSVSTAIMVIGFTALKSLVLATALKDLQRKAGLFEQRLWEHSLGVSLAASLIARKTNMISHEEAFVAGLMHDMGKIVINNNLSETYGLVIERVYEEGIPFLDAENEMLGFNHCQAGGLVARTWKLPLKLEVVVAYHHADVLPAFGDRDCEKLCRVVKIADAMALHLGIGLQRNLELSDIDCGQIGMDNGKFRELIASFQKVYDEQKESLRV